MKNLLLFVLMGATLLGIDTKLFAQKKNENALLWEVTSPNQNGKSYIFGTVHIICEEDFFMNENIQTALKMSDAFYAELDFSDMKSLMKLANAVKSDVPLSKRLSPDDYKEMAYLLQKNLKTDIAEFENMSDMGIMSNLTMKSYPCENKKMYEVELLNMALKNGKKLGGLETAEHQMAVLDKAMNEDAILEMLRNMDKNGFETTEKMNQLYLKQDVDGLYEFSKKESMMSDEAFAEILQKRNEDWITKMPEMMAEKNIFFAVGAGHLGGKTGILNLLREKGFTVKPVN